MVIRKEILARNLIAEPLNSPLPIPDRADARLPKPQVRQLVEQREGPGCASVVRD